VNKRNTILIVLVIIILHLGLMNKSVFQYKKVMW